MKVNVKMDDKMYVLHRFIQFVIYLHVSKIAASMLSYAVLFFAPNAAASAPAPI